MKTVKFMKTTHGYQWVGDDPSHACIMAVYSGARIFLCELDEFVTTGKISMNEFESIGNFDCGVGRKSDLNRIKKLGKRLGVKIELAR